MPGDFLDQIPRWIWLLFFTGFLTKGIKQSLGELSLREITPKQQPLILPRSAAMEIRKKKPKERSYSTTPIRYEDPILHRPPPTCCPVGSKSPAAPRRKQKKAFVWPRDVKYNDGRWGNWDRLKDVLRGRGPDIWVSNNPRHEPEHAIWSGWRSSGYQAPWNNGPRWDDRGYFFDTTNEILSPFKSARREDGKKYDHYSRRFRLPGPGVWSDVERGPSGERLYTRDHLGHEWVNPIEDGGRFNFGLGPNPFFVPPNMSYAQMRQQQNAQKTPPWRYQ